MEPSLRRQTKNTFRKISHIGRTDAHTQENCKQMMTSL